MKVLLIEQSRLLRVFLSRLFDGLGLKPEIAGDKETALRQIRDPDLRLICMNRYLDGTDAFEFVGEIRSHDCYAPLLMLTADGSQHVQAQALDVGIAEVIPKDSMPEMAEKSGHLEQDAGMGCPRLVGGDERRTEVEDAGAEALVGAPAR